jgi:thioredoxin-like negative regulator of GroEL
MTPQEEIILEQLRTSPAVVAYLSTPECNVCKVLRPKVEEEVAGRATVEFMYVDSAEHPAVAAQHMVFAAPTLLIFIEGKEYRRFSRNFMLEDFAFALDRAGLL